MSRTSLDWYRGHRTQELERLSRLRRSPSGLAAKKAFNAAHTERWERNKRKLLKALGSSCSQCGPTEARLRFMPPQGGLPAKIRSIRGLLRWVNPLRMAARGKMLRLLCEDCIHKAALDLAAGVLSGPGKGVGTGRNPAPLERGVTIER